MISSPPVRLRGAGDCRGAIFEEIRAQEAAAVARTASGQLRRSLYGRQTVAGVVCLRQATIGVKTGAATPTSSVATPTPSGPPLSIATPKGPLKGPKLPDRVPSLLSAVTLLPMTFVTQT